MQTPVTDENEAKQDPRLFRLIRWVVRRVSPKYTLAGTDRLPDEPCVIVGNHCQMYGPIAAELYMPRPHSTWCVGEMTNRKEVPAYAFRDFWSAKPKSVRWLFRIASYLIAPLSVCVFNNANCIGVYRDTRALSTFRETLKRLDEGARVIIFPEEDVPYNGIVWQFQSGFVDVARMYHMRAKQPLQFVPLYVAPELKSLVLGKPIAFDPARPLPEERERLCRALAEAITELARDLPEHTVVPYPNMPRRAYPKNTLKKETES